MATFTLMIVFRRIEIRLNLPSVLPLVDILRAQVDKAGEKHSAFEPEHWRPVPHVPELRAFLALFDVEFFKSGLIVIQEANLHSFLRSCSFLRLQARADLWAAFSDARMEAGLVASAENNKDNCSISYFDFLAVLQEVLIKQFRSGHGWTTQQAFVDFSARVRQLFGGRKTGVVSSEAALGAVTFSRGGSWQVIVLNDPVNLMAYVTHVLSRVVRLPDDVAKRHMNEIHEAKSSVVWVGAKDKAERYVQTLRSWHLHAEFREEGA